MSEEAITDEQIKQVFNHFFELDPRQADLSVIEMLGMTDSALAEYIWDHWMGEPDEPTMEQVHAAIKLELQRS